MQMAVLRTVCERLCAKTVENIRRRIWLLYLDHLKLMALVMMCDKRVSKIQRQENLTSVHYLIYALEMLSALCDEGMIGPTGEHNACMDVA
jgi:hypothetical protein